MKKKGSKSDRLRLRRRACGRRRGHWRGRRRGRWRGRQKVRSWHLSESEVQSFRGSDQIGEALVGPFRLPSHAHL